MKVFFKGYYGFENLGDDIFVHVAKWYCEKYGIDYLIHGKNLPDGIKGKNVRNKVEKLMFDILYSCFSNQIIYWGGSTFERVSNKSDLKYWLNKFKMTRKKVSAFSISVGPFGDKKEEIKTIDFLKKINFVGVRDESSLKYYSKANFTFDLAILAPTIFEKSFSDKSSEKLNIAVNISKAINYEEYTQLYKEFLLNNESEIEQVSIIVFNPDDYEKSIDFYNQIKSIGLSVNLYKYTTDTKLLIDVLSSSDILLGNRLHSGILAYAYNIPFVLNEYHPKCTDFLNTINHQIRIEEMKVNKLSINDLLLKYNSTNAPDSYKKIMLTEMDRLYEMIK